MRWPTRDVGVCQPFHRAVRVYEMAHTVYFMFQIVSAI